MTIRQSIQRTVEEAVITSINLDDDLKVGGILKIKQIAGSAKFPEIIRPQPNFGLLFKTFRQPAMIVMADVNLPADQKRRTIGEQDVEVQVSIGLLLTEKRTTEIEIKQSNIIGTLEFWLARQISHSQDLGIDAWVTGIGTTRNWEKATNGFVAFSETRFVVHLVQSGINV